MNPISYVSRIHEPIKAVLRRIFRSLSGRRRNGNDPLFMELESKIRYTFKDPDLLCRALSHRSYVSGTEGNGLHSYERLEFLGDAALGLVVSDFLYRNNPDFSEGGLTSTKSSLVSREALVRCSEKLDLGKYILISSTENLLEGRARLTILSDCFEALLGAIYIDGGIQATRAFIKRFLLDDRDAMSPFLEFHQAKNRLLRYSQEKYQVQPQYRIVEAGGPEHDRVFTCEVAIEGVIYGSGSGKSKKEAEKWAAVDALKRLYGDKVVDK